MEFPQVKGLQANQIGASEEPSVQMTPSGSVIFDRSGTWSPGKDVEGSR